MKAEQRYTGDMPGRKRLPRSTTPDARPPTLPLDKVTTPTPPAPPPQQQIAPPGSPRSLDLNVLSVVLGNRIIKPWYPSLYREEIVGGGIVERLFVCERCFRHTVEAVLYLAHTRNCEKSFVLPGRAVYENGKYAIYEVDGEEHRLFTQNLSLFSKLFIENKSVCFDVHTFLYYLLILRPEPTANNKHDSSESTNEKPGQIVGFFSKEKLSWDNNNLACILVFPPWQRLGLGQLLMGASYELSRIEGRFGGPERPLSTLGRRSYLAFWSHTVANKMLTSPANKPLTIKELSEKTYIIQDDIVNALSGMGILGDMRKDGTIVIDKVRIREWLNLHEKGRSPTARPMVDPDAFLDVVGWWKFGADGDGEDAESETED